ncbi:tetratricopeptide repeat protein [Bdellovibrio sp. HCB-162]|uniref:tetratricopeptide repeat protein n=1 Tax=Bdellovibrio sp. HCB-162 TaxID=3394234 RepID=UPI0039BC5DE4
MQLMKIDASTVEKYQMILEKDPNSQVFAPLAEAYREMKMLQEAQKVVTAGVQRHPQFVGGLVTYAKVMRDLGQLPKALEALKRATSLAPENILAHQLLAEVQLASKNPKDALKAFKMVLFLNPNSQSAQKAVQKLESLTADEYDEEVFSMTKLPEVNLEKTHETPVTKSEPVMVVPPQPTTPSKAMERMLSLIDAFIVRNDLEKAHALLKDTRIEFGDHPEIQRRMKTLQVRYNDTDEATPLRPLQPRDKLIREKKLEVLEAMLRQVEEYRSQGL